MIRQTRREVAAACFPPLTLAFAAGTLALWMGGLVRLALVLVPAASGSWLEWMRF